MVFQVKDIENAFYLPGINVLLLPRNILQI